MSEKISSGQTPSKVLHIRNLPYETTQAELEDLSRPFGKIVKTKLNVGANRNQAFIEFPDTQTAVNMVHHFMTSAEPAKVRPLCCLGARLALTRIVDFSQLTGFDGVFASLGMPHFCCASCAAGGTQCAGHTRIECTMRITVHWHIA